MELRDETTGCFVRLSPVQYQYPSRKSDSFDDNWLVIRGRVRSLDEEWSFHDACLQTTEAQEIGAWLRAVGDGRAAPITFNNDDDFEPTITNIEPNIGFALVRSDDAFATIRVYLSLESAPPSLRAELPIYEFFIDLTARRDDVARAAEEWLAELFPFPFRY